MPVGSILDALDAFGGQFWRSGDHLGLLLMAFGTIGCHLCYAGDSGSAKMSSRAGGSVVLWGPEGPGGTRLGLKVQNARQPVAGFGGRLGPLQ